MLRQVAASLLLCAAGLAACDARATPAGVAGAAPARGGSRLLESCAASADCEAPLRCFDQTCQVSERSVLGDYQAAVGAAALTRGAVDASVAAYAESLARYEADGRAVPADVDCAYGAALARERGKPDRAELAARVLHRCVLATPAGSALHVGALAQLAGLADAGLDPTQLARPQLADLYLTRAVAPPAKSAEAVTVKLAASPTPSGKSYPALLARLGEADVRAALVGCWSSWHGVTRQPSLAVPVGLRARYQPSDYDDEPGRTAIVLDPATLTSSPDGQAQGCVRAALEAAVKKVSGLRDAFATTLTITVE